jgi:predicted ATPase/class 3 adenylate cyclase
MSRNVGAWLEDLGFGRYANAFAENGIDFDLLQDLTNDDLKDLGIARLADRKRLLKAIADLAPTTPDGTATAASYAPTRPEAERRQLTVMFCDLVDSTTLSGALDPERLREVLLAYQAACAAVVERYDGHVAKYIGDGLLIYFGLPRAHEDDAQRAVSAGLGIVDAVGQLNRERLGTIGVELHVRLGVHTGLVVAGEMGAGTTREDMAIVGETPNIAARLQALATPNAVVISASTRRLVGGLFVYEGLGVHQLKGVSRPLQAWRVIGERSTESRFEALHEAGVAPLIGREAEVDLLLRRWEQAKQGEGQVVLLGGEPGIGKSRIIEALLERIADLPHARVRCQCSPYFTTAALHPFVRQLAQAAEVQPSDPPETKLDKLEHLLSESGQAVSETAPLFAGLLSIPTGSRYPIPDLSPQRLKERTVAALVDRVFGLARQKPVLFVIEDAHWIDPSSEELIATAIDRLHEARVLMVITHRPNYTPPWSGRSHLTMLSLNRLSRGQGEDMVRKLAGNAMLPAHTVLGIVAKADGVPLFVEELTKAVLESGALSGGTGHGTRTGTLQLSVPATLQDTLVARLDRTPETKEVAQTASVLGREFSKALLATISSLSKDRLTRALDDLVQAGLLFRQGATPHTRYVFKHALVQDAAYGTLLSGVRQQLHARVAESLEQRFPNAAESQPELLAYHHEAAGIYDRAIAYWRRSAARARDRSNYMEAERQLEAAIALVPHLPEEERKRTELELQMALGGVYRAVRGSGSSYTARTYARARVLCEEVGDPERLLEVIYGQFISAFNRPKLHEAERFAKEFMGVAQRDERASALPVAYQLIGMAAFLLGDFGHARESFENCLRVEGLDVAELKRFSQGQHPSAALTYLAWTLFALGYPEQAQRRDREAIATSEGAFLYAMALANSCCLHQMRDDCAAVEANLAELIDLSAEKGIVVFHGIGRLFQGWARAYRGAVAEGIELMRDALTKLAGTEQQVEQPYKRAVLAEIYLRAGRWSEAEEELEEALRLVRATDERWCEAELYRLSAELALARGDAEAAEVRLDRALVLARAQSARMWELRAAKGLARLWRGTGRAPEAHALLASVLGEFTEGLHTSDLITARAMLEELT